MPNPTLLNKFNMTVKAIHRLLNSINAEAREPNVEDAQEYAVLVATAEELRRLCMPVPGFDVAQAGWGGSTRTAAVVLGRTRHP